jgi:hypothetical protein
VGPPQAGSAVDLIRRSPLEAVAWASVCAVQGHPREAVQTLMTELTDEHAWLIDGLLSLATNPRFSWEAIEDFERHGPDNVITTPLGHVWWRAVPFPAGVDPECPVWLVRGLRLLGEAWHEELAA